MAINVFTSPSMILSGDSSFSELGKLSNAMGKKALIVTGQGSAKVLGTLALAEENLKAAGIETERYEFDKLQVTAELVDKGREAMKNASADFTIGLGGGASIDMAKAIAALVDESLPARAFVDGKEISGEGKRCLAVPTAFGSGAEVTEVIEVTDTVAKVRRQIRHHRLMPKAVIADPLLGKQSTPKVVASAGMCGMSQAIESFLSIYATTLTTGMSINALRQYSAGLPRIYQNPGDMEAHAMVAYASLQGGMAVNNAKQGLVHAVASSIAARYPLPFGALCGVLLPYVLRFNHKKQAEKVDALSRAMGLNIVEFTEKARDFMKIPSDLKTLKMSEADMNAVADDTMSSPVVKANVREVSRDAVVALLKTVSGQAG